MSSPDEHLVSFRRIPAALRSPVFERFARRLRDQLTRGRDFHCVISTDADLQRLNREFLGKDYATDVLSFPAAPGPRGGRESLGDLAISLPRARAQADEFGHTLEQEVGVLMLHGVLHLMGMDHESDGGHMARAEKRWRARLGLPNGLIERTSS